ARGAQPRAPRAATFIPGRPTQPRVPLLPSALAAGPGGIPSPALALVVPMSHPFAYSLGLLTQRIPRSGGDYMLVSRVIHPAVGLVSSFCMTLAGLLSNAFFGIAFVTIGLAPGLTGVGLISGHSTLVRRGTEIPSKHWTI